MEVQNVRIRVRTGNTNVPTSALATLTAAFNTFVLALAAAGFATAVTDMQVADTRDI